MTKHNLVTSCNGQGCQASFVSDANDFGPPDPRALAMLPDGWRRIRVQEMAARNVGAGPWLEFCPDCCTKLAWLIPEPPPNPTLKIVHQADAAVVAAD